MRMREFVVKRSIHTLITLLIVLTLLFLIFRMMPSDPAAMVVDPTMPPEAKHLIAQQYGFEQRVDYEKTLDNLQITQNETLTLSYSDYPDLLDLPSTVFSFNVTLDGVNCNEVNVTIYHDGKVYGTSPDGIPQPDETVGSSAPTNDTDALSANRVSVSYANGIPGSKNNTKMFVVIDGTNITGTAHFNLIVHMASAESVPLYKQYVIYMKSMLTLDFGDSFITGQPVWDELKTRVPPTALLFGTATILAYLIGIALGVVLAWRRGTHLELGALVISLVFYSMPLFWFGLIMLWIFSFQYHIFPLGGMMDPPPEGGWKGLQEYTNILWHLTLPLLTLTVLSLAGNILLMRNSMLEVMGDDFIVTAKAKGLSERTVMYKHAARNATLPVVTAMALSIGAIISGGVLTETIFSWPGMGKLLVDSTIGQNFPVVQGTFFILAILTILGNILADLLYAYLDPRVQL